MVPVINSKAQRVLGVSLAGNLTILEKVARRQSGGQRRSARYCDPRAQSLPFTFLSFTLVAFHAG